MSTDKKNKASGTNPSDTFNGAHEKITKNLDAHLDLIKTFVNDGISTIKDTKNDTKGTLDEAKDRMHNHVESHLKLIRSTIDDIIETVPSNKKDTAEASL